MNRPLWQGKFSQRYVFIGWQTLRMTDQVFEFVKTPDFMTNLSEALVLFCSSSAASHS